MNKISRYVLCSLAFAGVLLFTGCDLVGGDDPKDDAATGVLVANQGNFSQGNGSVTAYDPETGQVGENVVSGLSASVQSIHVWDGKLYVVTTGDRIDVYDAETYARVGQIANLVSPRYLVQGTGSVAYVTNQYGAPNTFTGGKISVLDLATNTKVKDIPVADNPEGLALLGNRLFVTHHAFGNGRSVSIVDVAAGAVVGSIDVDCDGPRSVFVDADDDVVVFCTGRTIYDENYAVVGETNAAVHVADGETGAVVKRIELNGRLGTPGPGQDAFFVQESREIFVVLGEHTIVRFDTGRNEVAGQIGPLPGAPIGAVGYDADRDQLYVAHVPGFAERGTVTIHDRSGAQVGSFTAGVAPSHFAFRRP